MDKHIGPLARAVPSYVQDTTDFIRKLRALPDVHPGCLLVTADVESLYTNIPTDQGLNALQRALGTRPPDSPSTAMLATLAKLVLTRNAFQFNGNYYSQISGTAMGTKMAPNYAILYMAQFEQDLLANSDLKPLCWWRYIDDIFFLWPHGIEALQRFMDFANSRSPCLNLTFEYSETSIAFLDVTVTLSSKGAISTDIYRKPTDIRQYLHFDSCHPLSHKLPIAFSQALRIRRICSDFDVAAKRCRELKFDLIKCGYPRKAVANKISKVLRMNRDDLLSYKESDANTDQPVYWVCTFHPDLCHAEDILKKHWHLIGDKGFHLKVYWRVPVKLKQILVRSSLILVSNRCVATAGPTRVEATTPCLRSRCKTCSLINPSPVFKSFTTGLRYRVRSFGGNCVTANVVYLITFSCGQIYVGETCQPLKDRMTGHRFAIKHSDTRQPVASHFIEHGHCMSDVSVAIIEQTASDKERFRAEKRWISQLVNDHPFGLNLEHMLAKDKHVKQPNLLVVRPEQPAHRSASSS